MAFLTQGPNLTTKGVMGQFLLHSEVNPAQDILNAVTMYNGESNQETETYSSLGGAARMRKKEAQMEATKASEYKVVVTNEDYDAQQVFTKKQWRREKYGEVMRIAAAFGQNTSEHWIEMLAAAIKAGAGTLCYDGQYFFDTDHQEGKSGAQSNKIGVSVAGLSVTTPGTAANPSAAALIQCAFIGVQALKQLKNDQGAPVNGMASSFMVLTPMHYMLQLESARSLPTLEGMDGNLARSAQSKLEFKDLAWLDGLGNKIVVIRTDSVMKPFIRQEEGGLEYWMLGPESENYKKESEIILGVESSRALAFADYKTACLVELS